MLIHSRK